MAKFGGTVFLVLFGLFWCSIVFLCDTVFLWNAGRQVRASGFAETAGVVTHSELKVEHDSEGSSYKPEISFRFDVAGRQYEAHQPRYDYISFGEHRAQDLVRNFPVGQTVTAYYDPAAPADAVLERGIDVGSFFGFLFLAPFNAVAFAFVGGFFLWRRSVRLDRPVLGVVVRDDGLSTLIRIYDTSPAFSALAAWGGAGFLSTFAVIGLWQLMPLDYAVALGWSATVAATFVVWRQARNKYIEIRRDRMLGNITLRERDGAVHSLQPGDLRPGTYSCRKDKDSDGDTVEKFPLELPFHDRASDQTRTLTLPEQASAEDAKKYLAWLNNILGLESGVKLEEATTILER